MKILRPADFVIGGAERPYLKRWWILPRNRWFNVYLHKIMRSDDDRAFHDHPWWNCSVVLSGGYWEITPDFFMVWRGSGSVVFRRATSLHRLALETPPGASEPLACWTLFFTGPRIREWGFACPQGWRHWRDFCGGANGEVVGRGCGEGGA